MVCGWAHPLLRNKRNRSIDFLACKSVDSCWRSRVTLVDFFFDDSRSRVRSPEVEREIDISGLRNPSNVERQDVMVM